MARAHTRGREQRARPIAVERRGRQVGDVADRSPRHQLVRDDALAEEHALDERAAVDREVEGLAHARVVERRAVDAQAQEQHAQARPDHEAQVLDLLEPCPRLWWHEVRDVGLAGLHEVEARGVVGHDLELGAREGGGRPPVMRVAGEDEALAGRPALERVGRRADHRHRPGGAWRPRAARIPRRAARAASGRAARRAPRAGARRARARSRACSGSRRSATRARVPASSERAASAAVTGRPSEKRSPGRSSSTKLRSSGVSQCAASAGTTLRPRSSADHGVEHPAAHLEAVALVRGRRVREEAGDVGPHRGAQHARVRLAAGRRCRRSRRAPAHSPAQRSATPGMGASLAERRRAARPRLSFGESIEP